MKNKIIYKDSFFNTLEETAHYVACARDALASREATITETSLAEEVSDISQLELDYVQYLLETEVAPNDIIAIADVGRWNGRVLGIKNIGRELKNIMQYFVSGCSYVKIEVKNGNVIHTEVHHDATNYITFRVAVNDRAVELVMENPTPKRIKRYTRSLVKYLPKEML